MLELVSEIVGFAVERLIEVVPSVWAPGGGGGGAEQQCSYLRAAELYIRVVIGSARHNFQSLPTRRTGHPPRGEVGCDHRTFHAA